MKRILIPLFLVMFTVAAVAAPAPPQGKPGGAPQGPAPNGELLPPPLLAEFLGLSQAQLDQIKTLADAREAAVQPLREQQRANQEQIRTALESGDAAKAGTLMLANYQLEQQIRTANETFRSGFEALLTAEQKAKFAIYQEIVELRREAAQKGPGGPN